jgi:hypothetical protein
VTTTTFELVRTVLDEIYPGLKEAYGAKSVGNAIRERSDQLSKQYGKQNSDKSDEID